MPAGKIRAFVAFEGGGAKGVVHVGALRAIEELGIEIVGCSGTSAGSIVAALAACGYRADELIDPELGTNLLASIDPRLSSAASLFGPAEWRAIAGFRRASQWLSGAERAGVPESELSPTAGQEQANARRAGRRQFLLAATLLGLGLSILMLARWVCLGWAIAAAMLVVGAAAGLAYRLYGGLATLNRFRKYLGLALGKGRDAPVAGGELLFSDFAPGRGRRLLKVVATDIERRQLRLFAAGRETYEHVPVADAVAASVCIPLIFRPWQIGDSTLLDGGLVSNLPAWAFDEERTLDPEVVTIAVEILDSETSEPGAALRNWLVPALRTAIFGRQMLNKRVNGRIVELPMASRMGLLDFDAPQAAINAEVLAAYEYAKLLLRRQLFDIPERFGEASASILLEMQQLLGEGAGQLLARASAQAEPRLGRVRVALAIQPRHHTLSLRLRFDTGYLPADPDRGMLVPIGGSWIGRCLESGRPEFVGAGEIESQRQASSNDPAMARVQSRLWPGMRWCFCLPVQREDLPPDLVVTIDGEDLLNESNALAIMAVRDLIYDRCASILLPLLKSYAEAPGFRE